MNVSEVMTRTVVSVTPDLPLRDVARLLDQHRISGVPVVEGGRCIGVISEGDLLAKQAGRPPSRRLPLEWIFGDQVDREEARRRAATTAGEAMSSPAITIEEDRPLREAAALMVERKVNRLPVTRDGQLVGIVTRADLVRAYLRLDAEILESIREDVLRTTMWIDPDTIEVTVNEGKVTLVGTVDRRSTARIIGKLVGLVDGVAAVDNRLTWTLDDDRVEPPAPGEREPGAASITRREPLSPSHR